MRKTDANGTALETAERGKTGAAAASGAGRTAGREKKRTRRAAVLCGLALCLAACTGSGSGGTAERAPSFSCTVAFDGYRLACRRTADGLRMAVEEPANLSGMEIFYTAASIRAADDACRDGNAANDAVQPLSLPLPDGACVVTVGTLEIPVRGAVGANLFPLACLLCEEPSRMERRGGGLVSAAGEMTVDENGHVRTAVFQRGAFRTEAAVTDWTDGTDGPDEADGTDGTGGKPGF